MKWIREQKRFVRLVFLIGMVIAIGGPWVFDRINVPAQFDCSPPNIRLEGDFCGLPLSLAWFLSSILGGLAYIVREADWGSLHFAALLSELRIYLFVFLLIFPVVSTAVLVLRGGGRRWQTLHIAGLVLAAGIAGLLAWLGNSTSSWILRLLWGLWLYILLTASLFALEAFVLRTPPAPVKESSPEKPLAA
jgi:hypothetical protein